MRNGINGGYLVVDRCNYEGCETEIDRGLDFLCGDEPCGTGTVGCGKWFCYDYLRFPEESSHQLCKDCA